MKQSKQEFKDAILLFAKEFNQLDAYQAMLDNHCPFPEIVKSIVYDMFVNEYNNYITKNDDLFTAWHLILDYSIELSQNGFVEFDKIKPCVVKRK